MKNLILSIIICLFINSLFAQSVPQGMKYQAVARDLKGELIANQQVSLKIQLQSNDQLSEIYYSENHVTTTNQFGLFSLIIGEGIIEQGDFSEIPWNTEDIWIKIAIKLNGEASYTTISNSKLLTVPYAFHAGTANALTTKKSSDLFSKVEVGVSSQNWSLFGNLKTDPAKDKLGTSDAADLVFVTDNIERLRITADGQIITGPGKFTMGGNLEVQGDSTRINKDLFVGRNVVLNFDDGFEPRGETINNGNFTVANQSLTKLTGKLEVDGATLINNSLTVTGTTSLEDLAVKTLDVKSDNANFVASFENINAGEGDGIKIKLGKAKAQVTNIPQPSDFISQDEIDQIKNLIRCDFNGSKITVLGAIVAEGIAADIQTIGGLTVSLGNYLIKYINGQFGPFNVSTPINHVFGLPINIRLYLYPDIPIPELPDINIPNIPDISLKALKISEIEFLGTDFWGIPNICLSDSGPTPLNNNNEFLRFVDSGDMKMGSIRAVSVSDWSSDYLNPVFLYKLRGALTSAVDKKHARSHFMAEISKAIQDYNAIGVEYSSGNGDYAEWLERENPNEVIVSGDIVAVKGGKITKNLLNAEQVMAVSHQPIVLGNVPAEGKVYLGNNIAFMGQIPVKIMGAVKTGDYVVGKGDIVGYGMAISPENMNIEDFKLAVGRSWETNLDSGPKMINTVVGVHNGDYINILKRYEQKFRESESRLESVEAKIDALTGIITQNNKINL